MLPVISASSSVDCFDVAIEACRLAVQFMTPVILLSDGYMANASEPWLVPDITSYKSFPVSFETETENFTPAKRDPETLARVWAKPGTPGLEHRIGGIEKDIDTGNISYDSENHQAMTDLRERKIENISQYIPEQTVSSGPEKGKLAVVGWGSTYGAIHQAVKRCLQEKLDVAHIHVRYLNPLPGNLEVLLGQYENILVPEMNTGQFVNLLRSKFVFDAKAFNKVSGQPFKIREIETEIKTILGVS